MNKGQLDHDFTTREREILMVYINTSIQEFLLREKETLDPHVLRCLREARLELLNLRDKL